MKNTIKYLTAVALLLAAACTKNQDGTIYNPSKGDGKAIHFSQSSIEKEFPKEAKSGVIEVQIARSSKSGNYNIELINNGENSAMFEVPAQVSIPDGSFGVTVPVKVDLEKFQVGSNYKTTLTLHASNNQSEENTQQVVTSKLNISATFELEWEPFYRTNSAGEQIQQLATYRYTQFYTGVDSELKVERAVGTNIYRLLDWASGVNFRFIVNDDNTCVVPAQSIGYLNTTYNEYVQVSDMAVYNKNNPDYYASYPCTTDGKGNFSFYLIYFVSQGYFNNGVETMFFESEPNTTPMVNISFLGVETTETGFKAPRLSFSPNSYAKFYKATVIAGDVTMSAVRQEQVRQNLINDKQDSNIPIVTYFDDAEGVWSVPKGNYTAVALAYDNDEKPSEVLHTQRFTCDPDDEYGVKVNHFDWYAPEGSIDYSPYSHIFWELQADNVKSLKYLCVKTPIIPYMEKEYGLTIEQVVEQHGTPITDDDTLKAIAKADGMTTYFSGLSKGSEYTIIVMLVNQYGDKTFIKKANSTSGHHTKDFDQTKEFNDFLGVFSATAIISRTEVNYRVDMIKVNDNEVIIKGLSDMRDFTPELRGFYDKERHMIIIEPQSAGRFNGNYAMLGVSDGLSLYWGSAGLAIGYIGDELYWSTSPYSAIDNLSGYMFLLFNSPNISGASYIGEYVGSKIYSDISMKRIGSGTTSAATRVSGSGPQEVKTHPSDISTRGPIETYQISGFITQPTSAIKSMSSKKVGTSSKNLRSDLMLHRR